MTKLRWRNASVRKGFLFDSGSVSSYRSSMTPAGKPRGRCVRRRRATMAMRKPFERQSELARFRSINRARGMREAACKLRGELNRAAPGLGRSAPRAARLVAEHREEPVQCVAQPAEVLSRTK